MIFLRLSTIHLDVFIAFASGVFMGDTPASNRGADAALAPQLFQIA